MALEIQNRVIELTLGILGGELSTMPPWLVRPGRLECGSEWPRICEIYNSLTGGVLPEVMRPIEHRRVDAVLVRRGCKPIILEVDEKQHFNTFRAMTFEYYADARVAFDIEAWRQASLAKRKLEGGGFAKPKPPLFPGLNGRHKQRAFRDALCDLLPPLHGFAPTLRVADFEIIGWIFTKDARSHLAELLDKKLDPIADLLS